MKVPMKHPLATIVHRSLFATLLLAFALGMSPVVHSLYAQDPPPTPPATETKSAEPPAGEGKEIAKEKTYWDVFKEGGWIMWPLALLSMWCVALIIEGFVRIRLVNFAPSDTVQLLRQTFGEENYQQAWRVCKAKSTFLTNVLRNGLERIGRGRAACESAIAEYSLKESMLYRTKISYLSTIGVVSPMVGLLGTVTGMIKAFATLGTGGISDPSKLAAAIGEVLIATASGLIIAIPAFFLYYFFRNRLQQVIVLAEDVINQLMVDVKYEELAGIKIGEALETELAGGAVGVGMSGAGASKRVSQVISGVSMACPQCNAPIAAGSPNAVPAARSCSGTDPHDMGPGRGETLPAGPDFLVRWVGSGKGFFNRPGGGVQNSGQIGSGKTSRLLLPSFESE